MRISDWSSDVCSSDLPSTNFLVGAVKIGLSAGECGISYHLPLLIGAGRAFEIMLSGRAVAAEEAVAIGLVARVVDDAQLLGAALDTARAIAAHIPHHITHTQPLLCRHLPTHLLDTTPAPAKQQRTV